MNKNTLPQMPIYSQDFAIEAGTSALNSYLLIIRYYSAWNPDGSREPLTTEQVYCPDVFITDLNGKTSPLTPRPISPSVQNTDDNLKLFSGYATIWEMVYGPTWSGAAQTLTVKGFFEQAGYISLSFWKYERQESSDPFQVAYEIHYQSDELTVINGGLNPFVKGNPSVFSYEKPTPTPIQLANTENIFDLNNPSKSSLSSSFHKNIKTINSKLEIGVDEKIDFYRPSQESYYNGEYGNQESLASDGCSADYLYTPYLLDSEKPYFILKMKMPTTFIHNDTPDTIYAGYQVQELTIDTYSDLATSATRYAVNSRQLNDYKDSDGYAYLFLAPEDIVTQLANEQGLDYNVTKIPPVYTWNGKTGYVLDRGIVNIRLRGSDPSWEGNLINTTCYLTDADIEPINPSDMGGYYPELTGVDSLSIGK